MKKLTLVVALVAVLAVGAYTAHAGQQAVTPRQFSALAKRVKKLEVANTALLTYVGTCFNKWAGVAEYGSGADGYVYKQTDGTLIVRPGLALTSSGGTPQFYVPAPAGDCSLNIAARPFGVRAHSAMRNRKQLRNWQLHDEPRTSHLLTQMIEERR